jgi:choline-sulfatase
MQLHGRTRKVLDALEMTGLAASTSVIYTSDHGDAVGQRGLWGKSTLYEETSGIPLIVAGSAIPAARVVDTPTNLVDVYPFIISCVGESGPRMIQPDHPGVSLERLANGEKPQRTVLSEYHGMGSTTGAFAIRFGRFKYVHYVAYKPQLFDLLADPDEAHDLAEDPKFADVVTACEAQLRALLSPERVDARAKKRQAEQLERYGGRLSPEAISAFPRRLDSAQNSTRWFGTLVGHLTIAAHQSGSVYWPDADEKSHWKRGTFCDCLVIDGPVT